MSSAIRPLLGIANLRDVLGDWSLLLTAGCTVEFAERLAATRIGFLMPLGLTPCKPLTVTVLEPLHGLSSGIDNLDNRTPLVCLFAGARIFRIP